MGNCIIFKELGVVEEMVKVVTPNGGVMELYGPITAESVTNEFPGYAIFNSPRRISPPLFHTDSLCAGHHYYLLPTHKTATAADSVWRAAETPTPYRMSVDSHGKLRRRQPETEVLPQRYNSTGVWKVRLVIDTDQLSEILSQEARTEALIESVRTAAKCAAAVPSAANSDRQSWVSAADN